MTVISRDAVAADHLIYVWPQQVGPECEVSCGDDDSVVMCPAFLVGDRFGPGRHHWRTPDPSRPTAVYFVRSSPADVPFSLSTTFLLPPVTPGAAPSRTRILARGSVQVRCADASLLVAQFVGLPFEAVNDGVLRSVSRSVERMLARLLTRRVVIAGAAMAVADPAMLPQLIEELVAYNPAAGAVFGVELMRVTALQVEVDDGVQPSRSVNQTAEWGRVGRNTAGDQLITAAIGAAKAGATDTTLQGHRAVPTSSIATTDQGVAALAPLLAPATPASSGETPITDELPVAAPAEVAARMTAAGAAAQSQTMRHAAVPAPTLRNTPPLGNPVVSASGEIVLRAIAVSEMQSQPVPVTQPTPQPLVKHTTMSGIAPPHVPHAPRKTPPSGSGTSSPGLQVSDGEPVAAEPAPPAAAPAPPAPAPAPAAPPTEPPPPPDLPPTDPPSKPATAPVPNPTPLGHAVVDVAISSDGADRKAVSGEIPDRSTPAIKPPPATDHAAAPAPASASAGGVSPGTRVRVPGPNGLVQHAVVRQLLQGFYELEVGTSGETIWVPAGHIIPES
nr:hypothetical protein [Kofleriaceae bacterium]